MPIKINRGAPAAPTTDAAPRKTTIKINRGQTRTATSEPEDDGSMLPLLAGGAALVGAGVLARRPGSIGTGLSKLNSLRQQLMLSGFAVPKSVLGNVGASAIASAERRSLAPLKEFFSPQTVKDFAKAYRAGQQVGPAGTIIPKPGFLPSPSRLLGAGDIATQNALQRAGLTAEESARQVLQAPLSGAIGEALESPVSRYVFPFRRTPFNQFTEGLEASKGAHPFVLAGTTGAGAIHGAATADENIPMSLPFGVAAASRYGLPYAAGALVGRTLAGGSGGGGIESSALPVSEYGFRQAFSDPLASFEPAALRALRRLLEEK